MALVLGLGPAIVGFVDGSTEAGEQLSNYQLFSEH